MEKALKTLHKWGVMVEDRDKDVELYRAPTHYVSLDEIMALCPSPYVRRPRDRCDVYTLDYIIELLVAKKLAEYLSERCKTRGEAPPKRGDLVQCIDFMGFRNSGKFIFNDGAVMPMAVCYWEYGHLPYQFCMFDGFPPQYWGGWSNVYFNKASFELCNPVLYKKPYIDDGVLCNLLAGHCEIRSHGVLMGFMVTIVRDQDDEMDIATINESIAVLEDCPNMMICGNTITDAHLKALPKDTGLILEEVTITRLYSPNASSHAYGLCQNWHDMSIACNNPSMRRDTAYIDRTGFVCSQASIWKEA